LAIKFDYNQTMNQAKLLEELAGDMQNQCVSKLNAVYDNVDAAWSGQAAKVYLTYIRGVQDDLGKKAKYLRDTADFLRTAAQKMRAADAAAKQFAQRV